MVNYTVLKIQHTEPLLITKLARGAEETWINGINHLGAQTNFLYFLFVFLSYWLWFKAL